MADKDRLPSLQFAHQGGADVEYRTIGMEQTRRCRRCGVTETEQGVGKAKAVRFPGFLAFERAHLGCKKGEAK